MEHNRIVYTPPKYDAEIEYLESTGTQYIDTEVHPLTGYGFDIYGGFVEWGNNEFFGGGTHYSNGLGICTHTRGWVTSYNCYAVIVGTTEVARQEVVDNEWHRFLVNTDGTVYIDNEYKGQSTSSMPEGTYTMYIFNHSYTRHCTKQRIFYCKIFNSEGMIFDGIPVRKGSIGFMYDKVSKKLFANKGTGNFILGPDVANPVPNIRRVFRFGNKRFVMPMPMPYDSKIEYLKSNGNQYLDIGIIPKSGYRAICVYMTEKQFTDPKALFGQRTSIHTSDAFSVFMQCGTSPCDYYVQYASNQSQVSVVNAPNILHTVELGKKSYLDGNLLKTVTTTFNGTYTISIFAIHQNFQGSVNYNDRRMRDCRVYSFKLYNVSDTLIFDGIPVRRGTKGYMYDRVSGRLFGNSGTGQFTLGNDINN